MVDMRSVLYKNRYLERLFHTLPFCLRRELENCTSVLDIGCGPSSPIQYCSNITYSIGVEAFQPYLRESKAQGIHTEYLEKNIDQVDFPEKSFDAVILIEVIEHMEEDAGHKLLKKAEKWARKKVILTTPNGYFPMGIVDGNEFQRHLSGWGIRTLKREGYQCHGLAGLKFFYHAEGHVHSLHQENAIYSNLRFRPKKLFYSLNALCQALMYYFPRWSFGLLAVKTIQKTS